MSTEHYMTETHPAIDEFDIEGQEAAGALPPADGPVDVSERQEQDVAPREPDPVDTPAVTTETPSETPTDITPDITPLEPKTEEPTTEPTGDEGDPPTGDVNPDDLSDIVGPDGKYLTYRDAAKGYTNVQSMWAKKHAEQEKQLQELQQQNHQWQEWQKQQEAATQQVNEQQQIQQQADNMSQEQWAHQIDLYPGETVDWAAENYPQAIPGIVAQIRATKGDFVADELLIRYQQGQNQRILDQQQEQIKQVQQAAQPKPDTSKNIQHAMAAITEKYGEQFSEMQEDVSAAIQSGNYKIDFADAANIAGAMEHAFLAAFRTKAIKQNQQAATQPTAASPQAETGNPGQAGQPASEEDQIADEIVDYFNDNPYAR
jgi:hypothetical protein